jgi:hypothetical protein
MEMDGLTAARQTACRRAAKIVQRPVRHLGLHLQERRARNGRAGRARNSESRDQRSVGDGPSHDVIDQPPRRVMPEDVYSTVVNRLRCRNAVCPAAVDRSWMLSGADAVAATELAGEPGLQGLDG